MKCLSIVFSPNVWLGRGWCYNVIIRALRLSVTIARPGQARPPASYSLTSLSSWIFLFQWISAAEILVKCPAPLIKTWPSDWAYRALSLCQIVTSLEADSLYLTRDIQESKFWCMESSCWTGRIETNSHLKCMIVVFKEMVTGVQIPEEEGKKRPRPRWASAIDNNAISPPSFPATSLITKLTM